LSPVFGAATGLLLPALVGGWLFLQNQNGQLEQKIAQVEAELNRLGIQEQEIKNSGTNQIQAETQALATVLIRSALVGDIARYSRSHSQNGTN